MTVLTPEFTHFNLVIHLSKVKQLALPFCTISVMSRWSFGPRVPRRMLVYQSEAVLNFLKPRFLLQLVLSLTQINHDMT